jgi:hypothetical protein
MAKKSSRRIRFLSIFKSPALIVVAVSVLGFASFPELSIMASHKPISTNEVAVKKQAAKPKATPKKSAVALAPTPVAPSPTPKSSAPVAAAKPVSKTTTASRPQPVVTPSPGSNVTGLAPVAPAAGGSGGGSQTTTTGYTSLNWSGYMATTGNFTAVSGAWTATNPIGVSGATSADSTWIGIGGVSSNDLIQVGTQNIINASGQVSTSAFYELLPDVSQPVPGVTVSAGDSLTASIFEVSSGQWSISIKDLTDGQSSTFTVAYTSSHSSAEWIEEDPSFSSRRQIPFDNFQTVSFATGATVINGSSASIAGAGGLPVTMVNRSNQTIANPSNLSGSSFTVTRTGL